MQATGQTGQRIYPINSDNQFQGSLDAYLYINKDYKIHDKSTELFYPKLIGSRITIEPFSEDRKEQFNLRFSKLLSDRKEFDALREIFTDNASLGFYNNGESLRIYQIAKQLNNDTKRSLKGKIYTGYNIIDNETDLTIGRIAMKKGFLPGQCKCEIVLHKDYQNKCYGKEAGLMLLYLAMNSFVRKLKIDKENVVTSFIATAHSADERAVRLMKYFGMKEKENLSVEELRGKPYGHVIYEITADKIEEVANSRFESLSEPTMSFYKYERYIPKKKRK